MAGQCALLGKSTLAIVFFVADKSQENIIMRTSAFEQFRGQHSVVNIAFRIVSPIRLTWNAHTKETEAVQDEFRHAFEPHVWQQLMTEKNGLEIAYLLEVKSHCREIRRACSGRQAALSSLLIIDARRVHVTSTSWCVLGHALDIRCKGEDPCVVLLGSSLTSEEFRVPESRQSAKQWQTVLHDDIPFPELLVAKNPQQTICVHRMEDSKLRVHSAAACILHPHFVQFIIDTKWNSCDHHSAICNMATKFINSTCEMSRYLVMATNPPAFLAGSSPIVPALVDDKGLLGLPWLSMLCSRSSPPNKLYRKIVYYCFAQRSLTKNQILHGAPSTHSVWGLSCSRSNLCA
jgi:hypothetical protein